MTTPDPTVTEYFLIPLDDAGTYISTAEEILEGKGIPTYVQTVRPVSHSVDPDELQILQQLQGLLPASVHLPTDNPFLTLQVITDPSDTTHQAALECQCQCGTSTGKGQTCSGSGSGGKRAI